ARMANSNSSWICIVALAGVLCAHESLHGTPRAENPAAGEAETIAGLIHDLGDKNFKVRDAAVRRLTEIDAAETALKAPCVSSDCEIARLAGRILDERQKAEIARTLRFIRRELERGEVDRAVERFVAWKGSEGDAVSWQLVMDLGWEVHGRAAELRPVIFE